MGNPRAVMDRLTAAQNAHDLEGMLACFDEDYRSEQPLFPVRNFQGIAQVRANWSALLEAPWRSSLNVFDRAAGWSYEPLPRHGSRRRLNRWATRGPWWTG